MRARANESVGTLVVRAPNWVGDLVMATPVIEAALASAHWSRVRVLVRAHLAPVLDHGPAAAHVVKIESDRAEVETYRRLEADAVMLLTNSLGAAWRAFRARVPMRAGTALSGRRAFLTHAVLPPTSGGRRLPIPSAHMMRDVAGLFGILVPDLHPKLYADGGILRDQAEMLARLGVERERGYVLCCPGAAFGAAKLWPPEHFAAALDEIHDALGAPAVLTGGPGEEPLMEAVVERCAHRAISLAREKRSLASLKALVANARLLLVGDSGPRWYAAAFDVPCVTVMGPNFPEVTASSLDLCRVVRVEGLECAPCLQKTCPLAHHRCMRDLEPARVVEAALDVLERAREPSRSARRSPMHLQPDTGGIHA